MIDNLLNKQRVLFVTTKNVDYIRNVQEISLIRQCAANCRVIGFSDKSYVRRLIKVYWNLLRERAGNYDVVFVGFAPQLVIPVWWRKFRKCQIVIDFFISMYDTLACDRQVVGKTSLAAKFLHVIDKRTIGRADHMIVDTRAHGDFFVTEFGADQSKSEVLYLEADKAIYYPRERRTKENTDQFTVLYFGSILPLQGVEVVLKAAELLRENDKIHFVVIGPVKDEMKHYQGDNISYIAWLSQTELAEKIAEADLCLAGHFNGRIDKAKRTIPGKAYIYEAMGKKMILGDNPANHELFTDDDMHYYVEMGNAAGLAERIVNILDA